ncbi:hypothetical protein PMAYCL1PPCAC_15918, partial [Pristionchus mayeri]
GGKLELMVMVQVELAMEQFMQYLLAMDNAHDRLRKSIYSPRYMEGVTLDYFLANPSKMGMKTMVKLHYFYCLTI